MAGFVALFARKGGPLHRRSGRAFVYAMLVMATVGSVLASIPHHRLNGAPLGPKWSSVLGGGFSFYLVVTGLLTVVPRGRRIRWLDAAVMLVALGVAALGTALGVAGLRSPSRSVDGVPAPMCFVFVTGALLSVIGDVRLMRAGGVHGATRLVRHLWRMCVAMFIATASFFLGQTHLFPKPLKNPALVSAPVLLVLVVMAWWLIRLRRGRAAKLKLLPL